MLSWAWVFALFKCVALLTWSAPTVEAASMRKWYACKRPVPKTPSPNTPGPTNPSNTNPSSPNTSSPSPDGRAVFGHFIIGSAAHMTVDLYKSEFLLAQQMGLDAFALNIGKDSYTDTQLGFAYDAAQQVNFKVFLSFDFNIGSLYYDANDAGLVTNIVGKYGSRPAQYKYKGKIFVSSFGDFKTPRFDWSLLDSSKMYIVPNLQREALAGRAGINGGMSWDAWPSENNLPINSVKTVDHDNDFANALAGRAYMALTSPWFFTRWRISPSYTKNWLFLSDTLWQTRWEQMLQLKPQFVEIYSWNDFGESNYIGSLRSQAIDDQAYYARDMPHDAWRTLAAAYISAYKSGANAPVIDTDRLIYWYRPHPKGAHCADPNGIGPVDGGQLPEDAVFVAAMLKTPGTVTIGWKGQPGGQTFQANAGVTTFKIPMLTQLPATPLFTLQRGGKTVLSSSGNHDRAISYSCDQGYNYNAFVGSVPGV